jgi:polysaccharide biosynthesis transport protein
MSHSPRQSVTAADLLKLLKTYPHRWFIPVVACSLVAAAYTLVRPSVWEASQALTVRDEAAGGERPGKFHLVDDMKTVQETILELSKSHSVLAATLKQVGPPDNREDLSNWPSDRDITALQGAVKLSPPHGAEFGKTEVFYLQVQNANRQRAVALAAALSNQLKQRFDDLRDSKAQSMVNELTKTVTLAQAELKSASEQLTHLDAEVGSDLGELRTLADASTGDSPLRRSITEMETELRVASATNNANQELLHLLQQSLVDPKPLLAAPSRLLEAQPALRKLKESLVDAQLRTAQLLGNLDPRHPQVVAAKTAEEEIARQVRAEVNDAIGGVTMDLHLSADRCATLEKQLATAKQRLDHLAAIRADYANLVAEVHRRTDTLKTAENQLSEASASQASAHAASLISQIDSPETGPSPIGLGNSTIVSLGVLCGILSAAGILFLTAPSLQPHSKAVEEASAAIILHSPIGVAGQGSAVGSGKSSRKHAQMTSGLSLEEVTVAGSNGNGTLYGRRRTDRGQ